VDSVTGPELARAIVVEGATDYFFGRPFDLNPYARDFEPHWSSWRQGWLDAAHLNDIRGDSERARWRLEAQA
jgi:hypothetical protein